jgi:hypothetical protein
MSLFPIATACCGGVAAGALGAAAGAAAAAILHSQLGGALVPFDGAWLGTAFATPLGIVVGWSLACKRPEEPEVASGRLPIASTKPQSR